MAVAVDTTLIPGGVGSQSAGTTLATQGNAVLVVVLSAIIIFCDEQYVMALLHRSTL